MRRFLLIVLAAIFLGTGAIQAAPRSSQEVRNLKRQQKVQRKQLKEQQRAMRRVMSQHGTTRDERARMKRDLKSQRQVLKNSQKGELRDAKQSHKQLKPHSARPPHVKGHESVQ
jgi:gas vesicle protein